MQKTKVIHKYTYQNIISFKSQFTYCRGPEGEYILGLLLICSTLNTEHFRSLSHIGYSHMCIIIHVSSKTDNVVRLEALTKPYLLAHLQPNILKRSHLFRLLLTTASLQVD